MIVQSPAESQPGFVLQKFFEKNVDWNVGTRFPRAPPRGALPATVGRISYDFNGGRRMET